MRVEQSRFSSHASRVDFWQHIADRRAENACFAIVTVVATRGSVPCEMGAKAIIAEDSLIFGTLGGGKVEALAIAEAVKMLDSDRRHQLITWNLRHDVGMTCGGEVTLWFEIIQPHSSWHLVIFGAGHVAQALVPLLATLSCTIDVIDTRADWLEKFPQSQKVRCHHHQTYEEGVIHVGPASYVMCISRGHSTDRPVLRSLMMREAPLPFLGAIGSKSKRAVLMSELRADGIDEGKLSELVCPLGLPIGSNDPAEIAISIAAQLLERRQLPHA
ncbi:MAG: xanthine dehydrogenase accessory protein XdhC [Verrucomicrobia bacterium]|nr:MAG: xanthine dehydrogenase accessory protein XdhC [Verrucomicrobiota bacterium]